MNEKPFRNLNPEKIVLWLIILTAAALRFYNLGEMSLSNDELSSLYRIKYSSYSELIRKGVFIDGHPAGLQSFLYFWVKIFGDDTFILRFPFVVCSIVSTWLIYRIGKTWYNELTALLSASSFAFLSFTILFSQIARMYSPAVMFCLLTVYCWTNFLLTDDNKNKNRWWWGWIIGMSAALHLHYISFLFVGLVGICGLFFVNRIELKKYISGGLIALITFLPEIPIFIHQVGIGGVGGAGGWLGVPPKNFLPEFFFELFNRSSLIVLLVIVLFILGIIYGDKSPGINRWRILSITWFILIFIVAYLYSIFRNPILMYSTLLFVTPFLLLLIFSFVPSWLSGRRNTIIAVSIFSLILIYDTVIAGKYYTEKHFGVFREIAEDAEGWSKKYGVKNVPLIINVINPEYIDYYFKRMKDPPLVIADRIETPADFNKLFQIAESSSSPYFAYVWSNSAHPLEVPEIIRHYYPFLIERKNYFNAASCLFGKSPADSSINTQLFSAFCDFEKNCWADDLNRTSTEQYFSGTHSLKVDVEYSAGLRKKISELPESNFRYVSFSAWIFSTEETGDAQIAISFERNNKSFDYHSLLLSDFKLKTNQWQPVILTIEIPENTEPDDVFQAYIWNPSKKLFYIDDLRYDFQSGVNPYARDFH